MAEKHVHKVYGSFPPWGKSVEFPASGGGIEFIDLGLPSGTKWGTCNLGATKPYETGLLFAWGETQGFTIEDALYSVKRFRPLDYTWGNKDESNYKMLKYNSTDGLMALETQNDAAATESSLYRTPTKDEMGELLEYTTSEWSDDYNGSGRAGLIFTSKSNGNSIFILASAIAYYDGVFTSGQTERLWTSSLSSEGEFFAHSLNFDQNVIEIGSYCQRSSGLPIRPVLRKS